MKEFAFDLQRFADDKAAVRENLLPHLRMICNVANTPIFSGFISLLENNKDSLEKIDKYVSPIFDLVSAFYRRKYPSNAPRKIAEEAELFASTISISNSILDVCDRMAGKKILEASEELGNIANEMLGVCDTLLGLRAESNIKTNKTEEPDDFFIPIITATISYGLATLSTFEEEGLTPEVQSDINKALVKLGGATLEALLGEVLDNADEITTPFGPADVGLSVLIGILEGFNKYSEQFDYYSDDGLPEDIAKKEAILDAVSGGVHEAMSNYLHGVDDVAFTFGKALGEGCKWVGALFSGTLDSFEFSNDDKNYAEWVREGALRVAYGTSSFDDEIEIDPSDPKTYPSIYAQDGNDIIKNIYPNVTIYGGHGDDSISLYEDATFNLVFGGNGDDYIYAYDRNNTLDGGAGNDFFLVTGNKNILLGENGDDKIFAKGTGNSITGGAGDDLMILDGAKNAVIEYTAGDGTDVIYGYDASDLIKIKGSYSTQVSGEDILIAVANGGIIVKDAKDLKLNINTIEPAEEESLDNDTQGGFTPVNSGIIFMPTFRNLGNAIRGTNGNDRIENTLSNVMIYGFDGNDTIINYGNNVTINAGNGNDSVVNYGASVKVNGGAGDDYIYSEGKATINGGEGKDTVDNTGNNSIIDGGDGMDSIKNSGENTDINSGAGVDRIVNVASVVEIYSYLDDNYITNTKSNVTIEGSEDNDYIFNSGDNVSINACAGNNSVSIDGAAGGYQTVEAGNGDDTVQVGDRDETEDQRYSNYIDAGDGNNYINNSNVEISTISAGSGNDTIITGGGINGRWRGDEPSVSINAGVGNNRITVNSSMSYSDIHAGGGNDLVSIAGDGTGNIIYLKEGDDSVISGGSNSTINVGIGKNLVTLNANSSDNSIIAGNGDDYVLINDSGGDNKISLGAGNNTVKSANGWESVYAGDGDDKVTVGGGYINVGDGKNNVSLATSGYSSVIAGNGYDTINVKDRDELAEQQYHNFINAGNGNNYINNSDVELSTISAGSGNDTIITGGGINGRWRGDELTASINAGAGDNRITVNSGMTYGDIYAGAGNDFVSIAGDGKENIVSVNSGDDSIISGGSYSTINVGAGKNLITLKSGSSNNKIIAGSGNDSVLINDSGSDNKISLGAGNNTVKSASGRENVYTGDGDDKVTVAGGYISVGGGKNNVSLNSGDSEIISGSGDDSIYVANIGKERCHNTINAGDGNNYINNSNVELSAINAGSGNDTIITGGGMDGRWRGDEPSVSINAGAGNNKITVNSGMTYGDIYAGKGNDLVSISGDGNSNIISVGDGRNTIFTNHYYDGNYNLYNTIEAGTGSDLIYTSGNYSFINAGSGRNFVSLAGGTGNTIVTGKGNDTIRFGNDADNNRIIFGGGNDLVIDYHAGDTILSVGSLSRQTVGSDVVLTDGKSNMTLQGAKDKTINTAMLSSNDNVYKILVADKTAGDTLLPDGSLDTTPTALDLVNKTKSTLITGTSVGDNIINSGSNVTIDALAGNDIISNSGAKVTIAGGAGNDSVDNFGKKVSISGGAGNDDLNNYGSKVTLNAGDGNDIIRNQDGDDGHGSEVSISGGKGNDSIYNYDGEYITIAGGVGNDFISNNGTNVVFNYASGDGNDKISGFNATSTLSIAGGNFSTTKSSKNIIVTVGKGKVTLTGAASLKKLNIVAADSTRADLNDKSKAALTLASAIKTADASTRTKAIQITGNKLANVIYGGKGDDSLLGGAGKDTLSGGKGDDYLNGGAGNDSLLGGKGDDTLSGGKDNDTLTGGTGNDLFIYSAGNDVITDFAAGDKISIGAAIAKTSLKGSDAIFTIGKNTLTVTKGKDKELTFINAKGKEQKIIGGALIATKNATLESWRTTADASTAAKAVQLTGNKLANTILGGSGNDKLYGKDGNDYLIGGKGNDSLWGGNGADTFIYESGDGKDVIFGFDDTDMLQITGTFSGTYNKSKKEVYFKVGSTSNALTLKNYTATSFNVNGTTYKISGSKLK